MKCHPEFKAIAKLETHDDSKIRDFKACASPIDSPGATAWSDQIPRVYRDEFRGPIQKKSRMVYIRLYGIAAHST